MYILKSLLFNIFFYFWTMLCGLCIFPLIFLPRSFSLKVARTWSKSVLKVAKWIINLDYEVRGLENISFENGVIIACKHQSAWETIVFSSLFIDPAIILKNSLMHIPLFGWFLVKLEMIPVKRQRKKGTRDLKLMLEKAKKAVSLKRPLVIFPEGTRTDLHEEKPYHSGIFTLYSHLNVPVVPAALNSGLFWGRRKFLKKPGKIILVFESPLKSGLNRHDFMKNLRHAIETRTLQLIEEGNREKSQRKD